MTDQERVSAFIDEVLTQARIPSRRRREDLRRELLTHFDDAARAGASLDEVFVEFGLADEVSSQLCTVYRGHRLLAHALRIASGLIVSILVALGIELAAGRPGAFRSMAGLAGAIVLVLVLWRELVGRRLRRPTAAARAACWLAGFVALAAWEYGIHHYAGIPMSVLRAAAIGGVFITVAASTVFIMAGADRAFSRLVQSHGV
jgi:hypothetical protein